MVRLLLQRNARADIEDKYGDLAIDHASERRTSSSFEVSPISARSNEDLEPTSSSPRGGMPPSFSYELLLRTIKFLDAKDVCRAACVAGKWHRGFTLSEYLFGLFLFSLMCGLNSTKLML